MAKREDNLVKFTSEQSREEAVKNGRKGGIASGKARRERKTINSILTDLMSAKIKDMPQFAEVANKLGITNDKSIKDLFVIVCVFNNLEKGNIYDLEKLSELLNEDSGNNNGILEDILNAVNGIKQ